MKLKSLMAILVPWAATNLSFADGMPIGKNGRFYGGPTTVIILTKEQIKILSLPEENWKRISLTDEQLI